MSSAEDREAAARGAEQQDLDQHPRPVQQERAPAAAATDETGQAGLDQHPRPGTVSRTTTPEAGRVGGAAGTAEAPPRARAEAQPAETERYVRDGEDPLGRFHKGLPHDKLGEVVPKAFDSLLTALQNPTAANFAAIQLGLGRKLTNPQAGLATDLEGPDPKTLNMPAPPALDSGWEAAEAGELYWMALLRDVPFTRFGLEPRVAQAAEDLSKFSEIARLYKEGKVTPATIFRGFTEGDRQGPYVSQFLLQDIPYGSLTISQRQRTVVGGLDYLTRFEDWLAVQNGATNVPPDELDGTRRYMRNMRDLGQYVHVDALYEAYLNACLILLGIGAPFDDGNPYKKSQTQIGFGTFGGPHILSLVTEVATRALKAVWYQKWFVHRRLRPEAFGGLVHLDKTKTKDYPIHSDIEKSATLQATYDRYGTYLLPMAFPEGSPTHPAYGAGHATVAGACVTILKAWFDQDWPIPNPVVPTIDGLELNRYTGPDAGALTVGGELNKVAANIAIGRNMAGVHWRTDYTESVRLGEQVALCILKKQSMDYHEDGWSFTLTTFDNRKIKIEKG